MGDEETTHTARREQPPQGRGPGASRIKPLYGPHFWLGLILTAGEFYLIYTVTATEIPEANQRIADMLFGSYTTAWLGAMAYWYNHTRSSDNKTDLLSKAPPIKED